MTEAERPTATPSELEGGGTEQTWGKGEGQHEPTLPHTEGEPTTSYADGTARKLDDPDLPLTREDEGMDR